MHNYAHQKCLKIRNCIQCNLFSCLDYPDHLDTRLFRMIEILLYTRKHNSKTLVLKIISIIIYDNNLFSTKILKKLKVHSIILYLYIALYFKYNFGETIAESAPRVSPHGELRPRSGPVVKNQCCKFNPLSAESFSFFPIFPLGRIGKARYNLAVNYVGFQSR